MRYVSLFSGIEAASVAWGPLGWEPVAFAEEAVLTGEHATGFLAMARDLALKRAREHLEYVEERERREAEKGDENGD